MSKEEELVQLDWLSFTIPYSPDNLEKVYSFFSNFPIKHNDYGGYGYSESSEILDGGRVFWHKLRKDMGIHVRLNSKSLSVIETTPVGMLNRILDWGGRFTRIDFALDDLQGLLDMNLIHDKLRLGEVSTRWRKVNLIRSSVIAKGSDSGQTIGVGSRESDSYLRIYDKLLEQTYKNNDVSGIEKWVRVELELKGDKANQIGEMIAKTATVLHDETPTEIVTSLLLGLIDFKEKNENDVNKSRWETSEWWLKFLRNNRKLRLGKPKEEKTLEDKKKWVRNTVSPTLAMIVLSGFDPNGNTGFDFIVECMILGAARLTEHQQLTIDRHIAFTETFNERNKLE